MDSSGFSSPRPDCFPAGLRVLVVDDDPTWLKILEKMLKKCNYEVTTCNLAREALDLLRERKDGFDIVISDVNMPDMDGFKLLEHVGLEMDLPVIMMSVDGETSRVMKGVQHGACDYLLKPIRMKELRNIWQHVFRKRIHEMRDIEGQDCLDEIQVMRSGMDQSEDSYLFCGDFFSGKKRKDVDNKHDDRVCGDPASAKKARVVWTVDLHQKFVKAVNQIGFEKVGPKKILDLMGVPWLTRENVASHLQKYRLYLSRLQKENELKTTFCGTGHPDISPKDPPGNISLKSPITAQAQQNIPPNEGFAISRTHNDEPKISRGNVDSILSTSTAESKKASSNDLTKISSSKISSDHSFRPLEPDVKSKPPKIQVQYSCTPQLQFKQEYKPQHSHSEHRRFNHHLPMQHVQVHPFEPGPPRNPGTPCSKESNKSKQPGLSEKVNKVENTPTLFTVQPESHLKDFHGVDQIPSSTWSTKNNILEQNLFADVESCQKNPMVGTGSGRLWDEEFNDYSSVGDFYPPFGNIESFGYSNQEVIAEIPTHLYDSLKFDFEFSGDHVEFPVMDQGVYI